MGRGSRFQQPPEEQRAARTRDERSQARRGTRRDLSRPESGAPSQHTQEAVQHLPSVPRQVSEVMPEAWDIATVILQKDEGSQLGVEVGNVGGDHCGPIILGLSSSGLIPEWNKQNPANPIRTGHIILETDGAFDFWGVLEKLSETGKHSLRVFAGATHSQLARPDLVSSSSARRIQWLMRFCKELAACAHPEHVHRRRHRADYQRDGAVAVRLGQRGRHGALLRLPGDGEVH